MMNKKVLFVTTISRTVEAFFIPHIHYFLKKDLKSGLHLILKITLENLEDLGVTIHHVPFSRKLIDKTNVVSYRIIKNIIKHYHILHLHTPISSFVTRIASSKKHTLSIPHMDFILVKMERGLLIFYFYQRKN